MTMNYQEAQRLSEKLEKQGYRTHCEKYYEDCVKGLQFWQVVIRSAN
jgi:hypothetical protein